MISYHSYFWTPFDLFQKWSAIGLRLRPMEMFFFRTGDMLPLVTLSVRTTSDRPRYCHKPLFCIASLRMFFLHSPIVAINVRFQSIPLTPQPCEVWSCLAFPTTWPSKVSMSAPSLAGGPEAGISPARSLQRNQVVSPFFTILLRKNNEKDVASWKCLSAFGFCKTVFLILIDRIVEKQQTECKVSASCDTHSAKRNQWRWKKLVLRLDAVCGSTEQRSLSSGQGQFFNGSTRHQPPLVRLVRKLGQNLFTWQVKVLVVTILEHPGDKLILQPLGYLNLWTH